ncbi:MAG: hypothetical protein LBS31_05435 [Candidatus Adiutrix sp.]|jgi:hypothetical protein|nr:hypothetical protein [Candidatus Adiutrix sp.]
MMNMNISELNAVTDILAAGLARGSETVLGVPLEVAEALASAQEQMLGLPEVIAELTAARERFVAVSAAVKRMIELADESAALAADDGLSRQALEEEFINLAKVIAADAGRQYYAGPNLSVRNKEQALSAARIIRYMEPVIEAMAHDLTEQRDLIHEVIAETVYFLGVVAQCYPDAEGSGRLGGLINEAQKYFRADGASAPAGALH